MGIIGKINKIKKNDNINIYVVETKKNYSIECEVYSPDGDNSLGLEDDRVLLVNIEGQGRKVVIGNLSINQGEKKGEKILYSRDNNGNIKAKIYLQDDGKINIESDNELLIKSNNAKKIRLENSLGFMEIGETGQGNINNNFTVDT